MPVAFRFGYCLHRMSANVMAVRIFTSARQDSLEGCERILRIDYSVKRVVIPAALYCSLDEVRHISLCDKDSVGEERSELFQIVTV